jgi:hypothetical protein
VLLVPPICTHASGDPQDEYQLQGPITDPAPGSLKSAYFTTSFSVTCGGDHKVQWGFDGSPAVGNSTFYDQTSVQFVYKLPGGSHVFWVKSDCGENRVKFLIGK